MTGRTPVHRRTIEIETYEDGEDLEVVTRLTDRRPWAEDQPYATLHDMTIRLRVDRDLVIVSAESEMAKHPHAECPSILSAYRRLVGLSLRRGFSREIKARFSGVAGCAHLAQAALAIAPAVMQASVSRSVRRQRGGGAVYRGPQDFAANSCHLWAEDGAIPVKLALGWRPGMWGDYPARPVAELRERLGDARLGDSGLGDAGLGEPGLSGPTPGAAT